MRFISRTKGRDSTDCNIVPTVNISRFCKSKEAKRTIEHSNHTTTILTICSFFNKQVQMQRELEKNSFRLVKTLVSYF